MTSLEEITVVPPSTEEQLNQRQVLDYRHHREVMLEWLLNLGKAPDHGEGYSKAVVENSAYRLDKIYRWIWDQRGYTTDIAHEDADAYLRDLTKRDVTNSHRSKCVKALKRLFEWQSHERGGKTWEPSITFTEEEQATQPRDYLTREERTAIREAALDYGSVPGYDDLSPSARSRWKAHLAQRFEKPKSAVSPDDWDRANDWKIPSLVWVSLDAGLRPAEVERATVQWVDLDNGVLRIPKAESTKNHGNWIVSLTDRTTDALARWLQERQAYPKYDETETLWLTREGNPYSSQSLRYLLHRLCGEAGISTESRSMSWYCIRHSVGTYMTREEDLAAAQSQLRHKSPETTMKYDQTPVEDRRNALDRMG